MPDFSIIIPTLNERSYLRDTILKAQSHANDSSLEFIVVDAGSEDNTLDSIEDLEEVDSYSKPDFRLKKYESLNYGIQQAKGDILIFLDADTILPRAFDSLIKRCLANGAVGGAFNLSFDFADWKLRCLLFMNRTRYRWSKIFYGDQAIFCSRKEALDVGGFPKQQLMEAAFFCKSLRRKGKLVLVKEPVISSSRRFVDNGIFRVLWFDIRMWARFALRLPLDSFGEKYWRHNLKYDGEP